MLSSIQLLPLLSYVLISSFTPGPANISSNSLGMRYGFRGTLAFQGGLALGVLLLMLAAGLVSGGLLRQFPALAPVLRVAGAAYILYLAFVILRASYHFAPGGARPMGFGHGLLLQVSNPKLMVYALTVFSSFLAPIA